MLSIIIPTVSRATLRRTLLSIRPVSLVEVLVIGDGKQPQAKALVKELRTEVPYHLHYLKGPSTQNWGNEQRNLGIEKAQGDHLLFIDDDDIYTPDAFKVIARSLSAYPDNPIIFRMLDWHNNRYILWRKRKLALGNIGTPMVCLPNNNNRLGKWPEGVKEYAGDAHFIHSTLSRWPKKAIVWLEDCIVICRPEV